MSVVACRVYQDKIVFAADSIGLRGYAKRNNIIKLRETNGMIIGSAGLCQDFSLLYHFCQTHRPEAPTEKCVLEFYAEFEKFRREYTRETEFTSDYLLAFRGHAFSINFMLVEEITDYYAIGAGEDFATAALYLGEKPEEAVKVACKLHCLVSEPIIRCKMERHA